MVKIRLKRLGAKKRPYYRVVVMDARCPRDGKAIEEIGTYHPVEAEDKQVNVDIARAKYWMGVGAQPTPTVKQLINRQIAKTGNVSE
ncbi:MAG: 30S ribosomal protein S16 [Treponema sp.]|nr:30S ribosomal protein S16 [Treponema sp.]